MLLVYSCANRNQSYLNKILAKTLASSQNLEEDSRTKFQNGHDGGK